MTEAALNAWANIANRREHAMSDRTILVTGVDGQVGFELLRSLQGLGKVVPMDRRSLDLSDAARIVDVIERVQPALIVNPAAYTAVDKAEAEAERAHRINAVAPGLLAQQAARRNIPLIHYSTDYVFNGDKGEPYIETDRPDPQNVYGRTKRDGEQAIIDSGCAHLILRTSWVYGTTGANFVKTMLRLSAERQNLRVVSDQFGAPTWARTLADLTAHMVSQAGALPSIGERGAVDRSWRDWWHAKSGIYHLTGGGETNWADFAKTIFALKGVDCAVEPISSAAYPTPAKRPTNSRLSNDKLRQTFGLTPPHWREALRLCLAQM